MFRTLDYSTPVVILVALLACKKSSPTKVDPVATTTPATTTTGATTPSEPSKFISDFDLARVCNELPVKEAKAYDGATGRIHPTIVFSRKNETDKFTKSYDSDLDGWKSDDAKGYELVACVTTKSSTKVKECKFDSKTPIRYLDLNDTSYDMVVYEAATGKQLGKKTVDLKVDKDCPMLWMFKSEHDVKEAEFTQALMGWAKQYVAPKPGGATDEPEKPAPTKAGEKTSDPKAATTKTDPKAAATTKTDPKAGTSPTPAKSAAPTAAPKSGPPKPAPKDAF